MRSRSIHRAGYEAITKNGKGSAMGESNEPSQIDLRSVVKAGAALGLQASTQSGAVKAVRVVDFQGQRLNADLRDDGSVLVRSEGKGIPGRVDEVAACTILVNRFNTEGGHFDHPEARPVAQREDGVDVVAKRLDGGEPLRFQVTRVDPDESFWQKLGTADVAEKIYPSVDKAADALRDAILKKLHRPQDGIILVLNGTQLPVGLPSVRDSFASRHAAWCRQQTPKGPRLRFSEVWVVESFYDNPWTFRLL